MKVTRILRFFFVDFVEFILVCLMVALCADIFTGVFTRYVMGRGAPWYDEVARYLFIWIAFLGAAVAVRRRAHFLVRVLVQKLDRRGQFAAELLWWMIVMGFSVFIAVLGLRVMEGSSAQTSPALNLSLSWVFLSIPVHGVLSFIYAGSNLWQAIRSEMKEGKT